jgi:hypothetical protein
VARGPAARRSPRGGVVVPAPRPRRARLATALASATAAALLAVYAASVAGEDAAVVGPVGLVAVVVLAISLAAGWTSGIAWTLVLLAVEYAAALAARGTAEVDAAAPLVGAGLLLLAELGYWSLELAGPGYEEERVVARRLGALGVLAFLSVLLGAFVVVLTAAPLGGGLAWDAVGVAAAGGTLAIVAWLAHRAA